LLSPYSNPVGEDSTATSCGSIRPSTTGAWYSLQGDDCSYTASTLGSAPETVLAVYDTLSGCERLFCLIETQEFASAGDVSWNTSAGVEYYILIAGISDKAGEYTLSVTVRDDYVFSSFA